MKKLLSLLLLVCLVFVFASCNTIDGLKADIGAIIPGLGTDTTPDGDNKDQAQTPEGDNKEEAPADPDNGDNGNTGNNTQPTKTKEDEWREKYNCITVAEALAICDQVGSNVTKERYYVIGTVVEIRNAQYGEMTIKDSTGQILVYGTYSADGVDRYSALSQKPVAGDVVLLYGTLKDHYGTREIASGWIIDFYTPGSTGNSGNNGNSGNTGHAYTAFTSSEKSLMNSVIGTVLPFLATDEYYVEEYEYEYDGAYEYGINFYTFGNTESEFDAYLDKFSSYTYDGTDVDEYGDTWYFFYNDDGLYIDLSYYYYDGDYVVDVYAYYYTEDGDSGNSGSTDSTSHTYTDFTTTEKGLMNEIIGTVLPFLANDEYYVEEYNYEGEYGINFYAFGNTEAEFKAYLNKFSSYTNDGTDVDEYGDTWYFYSKGSLYIDLSYYYYDSGYVVDVYAYFLDEGGNSGNTGSGSGGSSNSDVDLITNAGAGLPTGTNGVYDVDFTDAEYVKNVTEQGYYLDGCPTTGSPAVLVIPVDFSDVTAAGKGYETSVIAQAFGKNGQTDYYSVYDYYYISSSGALTLDITVLDYWFRPQYNSSYYYKATYDYYGESIEIGDQLIINEALAYLEDKMDLSVFDSDKNGTIDAVILVNSLDIGNEDFYWAYRSWNVYTDKNGYYYEYDGVSANDYVWASYQFLEEGYDEDGDVYYSSENVNPYTFIHEFAHVLGVDDYYDYEYISDPMQGYDIMDAMTGDHNAYSKFNLGWITTSRLVVTNSSVTLELKDFGKYGDTIIIANNWDPTLGAYQEYYVIAYYTNTGLNSGMGGYFERDGVVVYHVNASLYRDIYDGETYYDVYNNNTSGGDYGTDDNLIEYVKSAGGTFTYVEGDTLPTVKDDQGNKLTYTFTVDSINGDSATVTFTAA